MVLALWKYGYVNSTSSETDTGLLGMNTHAPQQLWMGVILSDQIRCTVALAQIAHIARAMDVKSLIEQHSMSSSFPGTEIWKVQFKVIF